MLNLQELEEQVLTDYCSKLNSFIEMNIRDALFSLDHRFDNEKDFYDFCKKNITRVINGGVEGLNEFYLDYGKESQILLTSFPQKFDVNNGIITLK